MPKRTARSAANGGAHVVAEKRGVHHVRELMTIQAVTPHLLDGCHDRRVARYSKELRESLQARGLENKPAAASA